MTEANPPIRIFLSYAREDQKLVEALYQQLVSAGFQPWMDTMDLLPGEVWMESIRAAIEHSDFFLACLSPNSVLKRGVLQQEFRSALEVWQKMLDSDIYFIPVRLENCMVPSSMTKFQWVDLFEGDGFSRLEKALRKGIARRTAGVPPEDPKPGWPGNGNHRRDWIDILKELARSGRRRPIPVWGSIVGVLLAVAFLPLMFNNYVYHVRRPSLPDACQESQTQVRLGLSRLKGCSDSFQEELAASWMGPLVETSIIPQPFGTSEQARQVPNYDVVIWGECIAPEPDNAQLHFEVLTSRKPYGTYEPPTLHVTGTRANMSSVGSAIVTYQHGNYAEATRLFNSLPESVNSTDLALLKSNSLLFAERYKEAITSYQDIVGPDGIDSAAAYNNMAISYFNQDADQGLDQFDRAVVLAQEQKLTEIEVLALVNRSQYYRVKTDWAKAYDDCSAALGLNGQSALPHLCMASYNIMFYRYSSLGVLPLNEINRNLTEAEKYKDAPALIHYLRGYWHLNHFWQRKQEAVDSYATFVDQMQNQACLRVDHDLLATSMDTIRQLTTP